jgi:hypothetical protein
VHLNISLEISKGQIFVRHRPEGEEDICHGEIAYGKLNWTAVAENRMQL